MAHYLIIRCDAAGELKTFVAHMLMELIGYKVGDIEDTWFVITEVMENTSKVTALIKKEDEE